MGTFLSQLTTDYPPYDKKLLTSLKTIRINELVESVAYLHSAYPGRNSINREIFDDVFEAHLNDPEPLFILLQNEKDQTKEIDIYEAMAAVCCFSGDNFENKISFLFQLFDFDKSGHLDKIELALTVQSILRAMCKLTNIKVASLSTCNMIAGEIFGGIDKDASGTIELSEFSEFVKKSSEIQDFFLRYTGTQTISNAERRMKELQKKAWIILKDFMEQDEDDPELEFLVPEKIREGLEKTFRVEGEEADFIMQVMMKSSLEASEKLKGKIEKGVWQEVTKALAAYRSVDINQDNSCNLAELYQLIWLYDEEQPNEFRINQQLKEIDTNGDGELSAREWIAYLCSGDAKKSKHQIFRGQLKPLFRKYDRDGSGTLQLAEIEMLLYDGLHKYYKTIKDKSKLELISEMIKGLARKVLDEIKVANPEHVQWKEFRLLVDKAMFEIKELKDFLDKALNE